MKLFWRKPQPEIEAIRYSECERVTATPTSPYHVRVLTSAGLKKGGGADSIALCGAEVAWDTREVALGEVIESAKTQWETWSYCASCVRKAKEIESA